MSHIVRQQPLEGLARILAEYKDTLSQVFFFLRVAMKKFCSVHCSLLGLRRKRFKKNIFFIIFTNWILSL